MVRFLRLLGSSLAVPKDPGDERVNVPGRLGPRVLRPPTRLLRWALSSSAGTSSAAILFRIVAVPYLASIGLPDPVQPIIARPPGILGQQRFDILKPAIPVKSVVEFRVAF